MSLRKILPLVLLSFIASDCSSQELSEAHQHILRFAQRLLDARSYHVRTEVRIYAEGSGSPFVKETAEAYGSDDRLWNRIGDRITVFDRGESVMVEGNERRLTHRSANGLCIQPPGADQRMELLQRIGTDPERFTIVHCTSDRVVIAVRGDEDGYASSEITLRLKDMALERIVYCPSGESASLGQGRRMQRIEVVYTAFELDRPIPAERFSILRYVRRSADGEVVPAPEFKNYELITT